MASGTFQKLGEENRVILACSARMATEFMEREERRQKQIEVGISITHLSLSIRVSHRSYRKLRSQRNCKETNGCSSRLRLLIFSAVSYPPNLTMCHPTKHHYFADIDTTKLKARQFARSAAPAKKVDNSLWTETPAERQQRIADEVSGKKRRAANAPEDEPDPDAIKRARRDEEIRRGVAEHTVSPNPQPLFSFALILNVFQSTLAQNS